MSFPTPAPGLVIRYSYLWRREAEQGRVEGVKDRPCAIVIAAIDINNESKVIVLPITHSAPVSAEDAVEIPQPIKLRLGLDGDRSWIVVSEANEFAWPGPDLRPLPGSGATDIAYGVLPPKFFAHIREKLLQNIRRAKLTALKRVT